MVNDGVNELSVCLSDIVYVLVLLHFTERSAMLGPSLSVRWWWLIWVHNNE